MRRLFLTSLLAISLIATACGGETELEMATRLESDFGPVMDDVAAPAPAATAIDDPPGELAFVDQGGTGVLAALSPSEAGVCVVLDEFVDILFDPERAELLEAEDPDGIAMSALMRSLDDGPFGAEWSEFAGVAFAEDGSTTAADIGAEFGPDWMIAAEQLAEDQCGSPVLEALFAAITSECFTPINDDGSSGEQVCNPNPDPR